MLYPEPALDHDPHLSMIRPVHPRTPDGCEECLLLGSEWVHLRLCLTYAHASGHPIVRSFEPGEDWMWCYVDEAYVRA
jgi:hypothetical protein